MVSGFTTYVPGDVSLMSRDIGHASVGFGLRFAAVVLETEPGRRRNGDRRAVPPGGGVLWRARPVLALLFSRPPLANYRLPLLLPSTDIPAGTYTVC